MAILTVCYGGEGECGNTSQHAQNRCVEIDFGKRGIDLDFGEAHNEE